MSNQVLARHRVAIQGSGSRTVVFGHGIGADQRVWRKLAPRFAHDCRVVVFDHVGTGTSGAPPSDWHRYASLHGFAEDLLELLPALSREPMLYVGHSASAAIGLLAAAREPHHFAGLVLVSASPRYLNDPPSYEGGLDAPGLERLLDLMDQNFVGWSGQFAGMATKDEDLFQEIDATFRGSDRRLLRQFTEACLRSDIRAVLPEIQIPALVLACRQDDFVPPSVPLYLERHLPRARLTWLDLSGHCPQMTHPALLEEAIRGAFPWLRGAGASTGAS